MTAAAPPLLALVGPTASGKTDAAIAVAEGLGCEIVSCDSMLVYRGMDIGTAKPTPRDRERIRHHLIDVAEPSEAFSVARYQELARAAVADVEMRGSRALLAGGTGLYYRAVVDRLDFPPTDAATRLDLETEAGATQAGAERLYERLADTDPVAAAKIEPSNVRRTVRALEVAAVTGRAFSSYAEAWETYPADAVRAAGIDVSRPALDERIRERVARMLEEGLIDEVRGLVDLGFGGWLTAGQAIGYAEMTRHLEGASSLEEAVEATVKRTRALARRQLAWFRRDPRIRWFEAGPEGGAAAAEPIMEYLGNA